MLKETIKLFVDGEMVAIINVDQTLIILMTVIVNEEELVTTIIDLLIIPNDKEHSIDSLEVLILVDVTHSEHLILQLITVEASEMLPKLEIMVLEARDYIIGEKPQGVVVDY